MPNRIIKESICQSDEIDALSWFEEVLFYRLMVNCDDYGRFDARPKIVRSACFPLKSLRESDIESAINKLTAVGLIGVYQAQGKSVLQLTTWEKHQQIRAKRSKYPACDETCVKMKSSDINCNQMISSDSICPRNPIRIQSESNPNTNPNLSTKHQKTVRHKYGEYNNVLLSDSDFEKLKTEFPADYQQRIERLSEYMQSTGKSYKDHLATMRSWARKEPISQKRANEQKPEYFDPEILEAFNVQRTDGKYR